MYYVYAHVYTIYQYQRQCLDIIFLIYIQAFYMYMYIHVFLYKHTITDYIHVKYRISGIFCEVYISRIGGTTEFRDFYYSDSVQKN